ncbi:MAG: ATP-binding protein [Candidatus Geothermincolia bacterium]
MTTVLAVSGKGGVGKTTLSSLIVKYLLENGRRPILAVDADSNSNLDLALGVKLDSTVGSVREDMSQKTQKGQLPAGMAKQDILEMQIEQALVETPEFDLISMGRPEGPGCYCAINNMLRVFLERLNKSYEYLVVDNEAGMEHLSRRTTRGVDVLFIVSDPSMRGLATAMRIRDLAREMDIGVGKYYLVLSRVRGEISDALSEAIGKLDIELAGVIPDDLELARLDEEGRPLIELSDDSAAQRAVRAMMEKVIQ